MKNRKRILLYLLLNITVSAGTMWAVFSFGIKKYPNLNINVPTPVKTTTGYIINIDIETPEIASIIPGQLEISLVLGTGDLESERIQIKHVGDQEIVMSGWKIIDQQKNEYTFPALTLNNGAAVNVHTRVGSLTVIDLFWGQNEAMWTVGEMVQLVDPSGLVHAQYLIP